MASNDNMTAQEYKIYREPKKVNKYGVAPKAQRYYDGIFYDSKAEMKYAMNLDLLKLIGDVEKWEYHTTYELEVNGEKIGTYELDFKVFYKDGTIKYIDVKGNHAGLPWQMYLLKKKLMKAIYNITIEEEFNY